MFSRPRQRTGGGTIASSGVEGETVLENGARNYDVYNEVSADKDRGLRPWRVRARFLAMQGTLWACRVACLLAAIMCLYVWLRRRAMLEVVKAGRQDEGEAREGGIVVGSFTVLVNTFKRPLQLERALRHYAACDGYRATVEDRQGIGEGLTRVGHFDPKDCTDSQRWSHIALSMLDIENKFKSSNIESIRVVWSEQTTPPDQTTAPHLYSLGRPIRFHAHPTTSLNNRFIPPSDLATDGVFVVDDDIEVPCGHLMAAFQTWKLHQDRLVGFFPRSHLHHSASEVEDGKVAWEYLYFWRVLWNMEYSIVLTKAAFLHSKYLKLYSGSQSKDIHADFGEIGEAWSSRVELDGEDPDDNLAADYGVGLSTAMTDVRAYVDSKRNCEDIAMQMAVTLASGFPPVTVFAPIRDIGLLGGISTGEGSGKWWHAPHAVKRSTCLEDLSEIFCAHQASYAAGDAALSLSVSSGYSTGQACKPLLCTHEFAMPRHGRSSDASKLRGGGSAEELESGGGDLSRISRLALALRAPTLAEFISADMLLVPAKIWQWLTKEDIFGRRVVKS